MNLARYVLAAVREGETIAATLAVTVSERIQARHPQAADDAAAAAQAAVNHYEEQAA
jgi:hypothetical protein